MNFIAFIMMILAILASLFGFHETPPTGDVINPPTVDPLPSGAVCDPATPELCSSGFCDYVADDPGTLEPIYECR